PLILSRCLLLTCNIPTVASDSVYPFLLNHLHPCCFVPWFAEPLTSSSQLFDAWKSPCSCTIAFLKRSPILSQRP
ncbi:hypothetical protein M758_11G132900, partial [Ceratodon purpureus]